MTSDQAVRRALKWEVVLDAERGTRWRIYCTYDEPGSRRIVKAYDIDAREIFYARPFLNIGMRAAYECQRAICEELGVQP